jgi:predicted transcriptional regulator
MYVFPPILMQMVRDRRCTPTDLRVFVVMSQHLDFVEFRPLKVLSVAHEMRMHGTHVSRSMVNLVKLGYLDRQVLKSPDGNHQTTFRLPYSARNDDAA